MRFNWPVSDGIGFMPPARNKRELGRPGTFVRNSDAGLQASGACDAYARGDAAILALAGPPVAATSAAPPFIEMSALGLLQERNL